MEGTEFEGPKATKLQPNKVGDYTGGEFKQAQLDGIIHPKILDRPQITG